MMDLDDEAAPLPIVNDRGPLSRDPSSRASDAPYRVNRSLEVWNATGSLSYATLVIVKKTFSHRLRKSLNRYPIHTQRRATLMR
jgi:hypothetical protein